MDVVDEGNNVEEDKEDVQNESRVCIIPISQLLNQRDRLDGEDKTQCEDEWDDSDKGHPNMERQRIFFKTKDQIGGEPCGHERQQEAGYRPVVCFSKSR